MSKCFIYDSFQDSLQKHVVSYNLNLSSKINSKSLCHADNGVFVSRNEVELSDNMNVKTSEKHQKTKQKYFAKP